MIRVSVIILFLGIIGCQYPDNKQAENKDTNNKLSIELNELQGIWALTEYFDSIVENKALAKYRIQFPAWFGILLEIRGDSITSYGSLRDGNGQLELNRDTVYKFKNTESGEWVLLKNKENLVLRQMPNQKYPDLKTYSYRRRSDLNKLTKDLGKSHKIDRNITKFFNKEIFAREYLIFGSKDVVNFKEDGRIEGLKNYAFFDIENYFGTLHPHKNLDVVYLKNEEKEIMSQYNWRFEEFMLILTEFVVEEVMRNGKMMKSDYYVLGESKIKLIQKN